MIFVDTLTLTFHLGTSGSTWDEKLLAILPP